MLQMRIEQQYARIGLSIDKPVLNMHTTLPRIELNTQKPELQIKSPRPVLYIDQTQCFADAGRRTPSEFSRYYADLARQAGLEAIGEIVDEGNMLGQIEKGMTVEEIAASKMDDSADFNICFIPKQLPKIDWDIRPVEIELIPGHVDLKLHRGTVDYNLHRGKVDVYIEQQNYLKISWYDPKLNIMV
ncbi:MAG: DUF6470 family protein [Syntrophomonadaceae bacterium]|jgi:hypothetical protein